MGSEKRSRLVIEPAIQYALVRQLLVQWSLHLAVSISLLVMLQVLLGGFFQPWQYHVERIGPTLASLAISMAFLLPAFIVNSLKLSNRFAGPIHRFRSELRKLGAGHPYQELKFRDGDYWQELSGEMEQGWLALQAQAARQSHPVPGGQSAQDMASDLKITSNLPSTAGSGITFPALPVDFTSPTTPADPK